MPRNGWLAISPPWARYVFSYGTIGAVCACLSNSVIIACSFAEIKYWNGAALAFTGVVPCAYVLQSRFTFGAKLSIRRFVRFLGGAAAGAVLFLVLISLFCSVLEIPVWIASPLATAFVFLWNFLISHWAIAYVAVKKLRRRPI